MKAKLLSLFCLLNVTAMLSQTYVPDDNFEQELINLGYDSGPLDDYVPTANITNVQLLYLQNKGITDLTGIEDFANLVLLNCSNNNLQTLDLSNNVALSFLYADNNQLTSLDISTCTGLRFVNLNNNNLTALDCSNSIDMHDLYVNNNNLTSLILSKDTYFLECNNNQLTSLFLNDLSLLLQIECRNNQIESLDLTDTRVSYLVADNNPNLLFLDARHFNQSNVPSSFNVSSCPNLSCILVNDITYPSLQNWSRDATAMFYDTEADCDRAIGNATNNNLLDVSVINPTENYTIVNNLVMPSNIYLYDFEGNLILERENYFGEEINTAYIEPGIYFFRIINEEQNESIKVIL